MMWDNDGVAPTLLEGEPEVTHWLAKNELILGRDNAAIQASCNGEKSVASSTSIWFWYKSDTDFSDDQTGSSRSRITDEFSSNSLEDFKMVNKTRSSSKGTGRRA